MTFQRSPNQQDLSWFIDMKEQGRLDLDPPYQRRSVWTYKDKQFFLDTVLKNYPCPAVYLQKESSEKGPTYNVVDGKQRLTTILDFHAGKIKLGKNFSIAEYRNKKFENLSDSVKAEFYNYIFMVEVIRSDEPVEWGEVFERVNKNQKKLSDQELRHARFDGWLITEAEQEVESQELWKNIGISSKARNSRMKDVEFISLLMLVILENNFIGFPQWKIDELYAKYDFVFNELPDDAIDLDLEDNLNNPDGFTKDIIQNFLSDFERTRSIIEEMENINNCITTHKKRLFTDFYSLWCALAFENDLDDMDADKLAKIYDDFISQVDTAYSLTKDNKPIDDLPDNVQIYYKNSTGAATEIENRQKRHEAFISYATSN